MPHAQTSFHPRHDNLIELHEQSLTRFAARPLFGVKRQGQWQWQSYAEFGEQVQAMRRALMQLGLASGERVAIISDNRPEWAVMSYASFYLGGVVVPMYEYQPASEWLYILQNCAASVTFAATTTIAQELCDFHQQQQLPALKHLIVADDALPTTQGELRCHSFQALLTTTHASTLPAPPKRDDLATLIYTSGTTGVPKGVMLSHGNLVDNVCAVSGLHPLNQEDCSLSFLPWAHSFGQVAELHTFMNRGAAMAIAESTDKIVDNLAEIRPTVLVSVPRIFNRMYERIWQRVESSGGVRKWLFMQAVHTASLRQENAHAGHVGLWLNGKHRLLDTLVFAKIRARFGGRLRFAISGGASLSRHVAEFIDHLGIRVYEGYGLTETSPVIAVNMPGAYKVGSVGPLIPGVEVNIDAAASHDHNQGEIIVYGHNVMQGYYELPEENQQVFTADGGLRTGDLGFIDSDGFLFITGRIKERYKLENGKYIAPVPLEESLKLCPWISNIMIYGDDKPHNVALIVPNLEMVIAWAKENHIRVDSTTKLLSDRRVHAKYQELIKEFSSSFKPYEKIRQFSLIDEVFTPENGLLTPSLKIKRREILRRYQKTIDTLYVQ